jgi:hypothetical protein
MATPIDKALYAKAKRDATKSYGSKSSAYRSGYIVRRYKQLGGRYKGSKPKKSSSGISKWFKEEWVQVEDYLKSGKKIQCGSSNKDGKACRPLKRVNSATPITLPELRKIHDDKLLLKITRQKQRDMDGRLSWKRGKFYPKNGGAAPKKSPPKTTKARIRREAPKALKAPTASWEESKPLYKPVKSSRDTKKGMVYVMKGGSKRLIHFGDASMSDYTKHKDPKRRENYLRRSAGIRDGAGNLTANDKNSANYYSRRYLW